MKEKVFFDKILSIAEVLQINKAIFSKMDGLFKDEGLKDKNKVVKELLKQSEVDVDYYFLLVVSTLITTLALIIDNAAVVIGGMLIAPLLSPILHLGLGIITTNPESLRRSTRSIAQSVGVVVLLSFLTAFFVGVDNPGNKEIVSRLKPTLPYMYIAILSGVGATFSWVKPRLSVTLPAIAIVASLLPPLCVTGIGLSLFNREIFTGSFELFFVNLLGIVVSSAVVFSLFNFHQVRSFEKKELIDEKIEKEAEKQESFY